MNFDQMPPEQRLSFFRSSVAAPSEIIGSQHAFTTEDGRKVVKIIYRYARKKDGVKYYSGDCWFLVYSDNGDMFGECDLTGEFLEEPK